MGTREPLLRPTPAGLWCEPGGFYVDPWQPVERAVLTHAHADHARPGSAAYLATAPSLPILRRRLGPDARLESIAYGEVRRIGDVDVSLHPAGHVLGSAQLRIAHQGEVWVVSGDYKRAPDPTCAAFEPVPCDTFVTEATFGLPIYRWEPPERTAAEILAWWDTTRAAGRPAVLFAYALGKAQRILAELARLTDREVYLHGAIAPIVDIYREAGVAMLPTRLVADAPAGHRFAGDLVLATPGSQGSPWMKRFPGAETALASGWMRVRGTRRRHSVDRGFVLSDHADWPALLDTVAASGAERILVTHGSTEPLVRWLCERGLDARTLPTAWEGEGDVIVETPTAGAPG
ncbi:MAG: ligase-associated DNA damage response exonuclease [Pseudomonadota bacterium]|nr:ligase-associated DNA damage response exonuclease [Pseudomonadota bacterium]